MCIEAAKRVLTAREQLRVLSNINMLARRGSTRMLPMIPRGWEAGLGLPGGGWSIHDQDKRLAREEVQQSIWLSTRKTGKTHIA